ncbi:serine/threonine-protein kinase [Phyllobacterium sp. P30BS-XVII]|uniref:protein kinase domain-containing protein n=1 Tax=Phyllobacterium sp. P30BS-XVII TaxID=2587046 RepID=UPI0015F8468D|nr:serine/threonine-protein kinase [Phyllobacterium sp. P30BS-XVII]MBA8903177.1 serine/threonine protein kinase [Phyllobacterium sp. P30BS-XVII]
MTAAARLAGLDISDGWKVTSHLERSPNSTGGTFSHSYLAERDGKIAFLKAFDFSQAFEPGVDTLKNLGELTASFEHERDILEHCRGRRLSHVALAIGHGHVDVPSMSSMEGRVYYLLFEKAANDVRCQMDEADASDLVWCMRALRDVCLGLAQVHREVIAHQDLKPSNVLCYSAESFKVADFGRSSKRGSTAIHDDYMLPGDRTYAPPELLYGHVNPDFVPRRIGGDLYMLGNLAAFLFTGTNMTGSILARLDTQHHWTRWQSDYSSILPYVQEGFARTLEELDSRLPVEVRNDVVELVRELCNPNLSLRGNPKSIGKPDQYSLERYVSKLTHVVKVLEIKIRIARRSA